LKIFLKITADGYSFGSYNRSSFEGYLLHKRFRYFEIVLCQKNDNLNLTDGWLEMLIKGGVVGTGTYGEYRRVVDGLILNPSKLWNLTNEQLYDVIHRQRRAFLDEELVHRYKMNMMMQNGGQKAERGDIFQKNMLEQLILTKSKVLVAVNDLAWVNAAFEHTLGFLRQGKQVFLLVKESSTGPLLGIKEAIAFAGVFSDGELLTYLRKERLCYIKDTYDGRGIDFKRIPSDDALQVAIEQEDIFLCGFGEDVFLSIHDLIVPSMVYTSAQTVFAQGILNEYRNNLCSLVYIPDRFNIFKYVSLVESPTITYRHFSALADVCGMDVYQMPTTQLYMRYPHYFINRFTDMPAEDWRLMKSAHFDRLNGDDIGRMAEIRTALARKLMTEEDNYESFSVYYDHDRDVRMQDGAGQGRTGRSGELPVDWQDKTLINGLLVKCARHAKVVSVDDYGAQSFRSCMRQMGLLQAPAYIANFMFFSTPGIIERYNNLRSLRRKEQIPVKGFHIDFYYIKEENGSRQSFPLYNKACIAKDTKGHFHFFRFSLGGGCIYLDEYTAVWEKKDVNPNSPEGVAVYTPFLSCIEENTDSGNYIRMVGKGRLNLVIIGDRIACIRKGEVLLPSVGVVVSLGGIKEKELEQYLSDRTDIDGYYPDRDRKLSIELLPPECISSDSWNAIEWSYGGGIMMIQDSICIYDQGQDSVENFRNEGWLSPLSEQTQESRVHDETELHPRTMLGLSADGRMFVLTFSGRSRFTRGVTYREACQLARRYIGDICFMMAVDGGASTFLGFAGHGTFMELNYPAGTEETSTGIVRKVNSFLLL